MMLPAAADLPGLPGVWAAARYLTSLTAADTPLIRQHSGWILRADPEAGLQVSESLSCDHQVQIITTCLPSLS
jgi:hypothetical protein